jgi:hypothetical protein
MTKSHIGKKNKMVCSLCKYAKKLHDEKYLCRMFNRSRYPDDYCWLYEPKKE